MANQWPMFTNLTKQEVEAERAVLGNPEHAAPAPSVVRRTVIIDSRSVVQDIYSQPFCCMVDLNDYQNGALRHVISCELKACAFPKVAGEIYFNIDLGPLNNDTVINTDVGTLGNFATVLTDCDVIPTGRIHTFRGSEFQSHLMTYSPALSGVSRFPVVFRKYGGAQIEAGDTAGAVYWCLVLEFKMNVLK